MHQIWFDRFEHSCNDEQDKPVRYSRQIENNQIQSKLIPSPKSVVLGRGIYVRSLGWRNGSSFSVKEPSENIFLIVSQNNNTVTKALTLDTFQIRVQCCSWYRWIDCQVRNESMAKRVEMIAKRCACISPCDTGFGKIEIKIEDKRQAGRFGFRCNRPT